MGWFRSSRPGDADAAPSFEQRLAAIEPGAPGHCPSCDGLGYIDDLDIGGRYQIQHCTECGHRWEYLFDAVGRVVGLTELDELGQPVARMRVRTTPPVADRSPAEAAEPAEPEPAGPATAMIDVGGDEVLDLRTPPAVAPVDDDDQMSPAEWIRHAIRR